MAPSPQKASWRRVDTAPAPSDNVGVGISSGAGIQPFSGARDDFTYFRPYTYLASGQQSSPLAGQGVSSSQEGSLLPSTFHAFSSPSDASAYSLCFQAP